jgi:hypothetical protein
MASLSSSVAGHGWQWRKPRRARTLWGQRKGPDEEWLKLYAFQEQYRKEHNVTASHILKEIGLPLSLATFLYQNRFAPGAHCGPLGLQLRQKLRELADAGATRSIVGGQLEDFEEKGFYVREFFEAKFSELREAGVNMLRFDDGGILVVGTRLVDTQLRFSAEKFQRLLESNDILRGLHYTVEKYTDLIYGDSRMFAPSVTTAAAAGAQLGATPGREKIKTCGQSSPQLAARQPGQTANELGPLPDEQSLLDEWIEISLADVY